MSPHTRIAALSRLVKKGLVVSPWRGFYVTVPTEYRLKGVVPPVFWLDALMRHLGREYYVSLLSAAEFYGAAHQRPMTFYVAVQGTPLRGGGKDGARVTFIRKAAIGMDFVRKFPTQMGSINVSCPELTALDLVDRQDAVGGLNRVATVLGELVEQMHWESVDERIFAHCGAPVVQRLGYILEMVLGEKENADGLMALAMKAGLVMRRTPLKLGRSCDGCCVDGRWKVVVNMDLEIDEI